MLHAPARCAALHDGLSVQVEITALALLPLSY